MSEISSPSDFSDFVDLGEPRLATSPPSRNGANQSNGPIADSTLTVTPLEITEDYQVEPPQLVTQNVNQDVTRATEETNVDINWDEERISRFKDAKITLPGVSTRSEYLSRHLEFSWNQYESKRVKIYMRSDKTILPSILTHYDIENSHECSIFEMAILYSPKNQDVTMASDSSKIKSASVNKIPTIFYAVYSRNVKKVERWLTGGADPNSVANFNPFAETANENSLDDNSEDMILPAIPVLAFAILLGEGKIVRALLRSGAKAVSIPYSLYLPYLKPEIYEIAAKGEETFRKYYFTSVLAEETSKWCKDYIFHRLWKALDLSMRYDLYREKSFAVTEKQKALASACNPTCIPLLRLHFEIIGQDYALKALARYITLRFTTKEPKKPSVLLFAGPGGHGKSELAKQLAYHLDVPILCGSAKSLIMEMELFGRVYGDGRGKQSSQLGRFLEKCHLTRGIVYIGGIGPYAKEILDTILSGFDDQYRPHKSDISQVIWILGTTGLEPEVRNIPGEPAALIDHCDPKEKSTLLTRLRYATRRVLGEDFTNRIDLMIPFAALNSHEQAVLCYRKLSDLREHLQLQSSSESGRVLGDIELKVKQDYRRSVPVDQTSIPERERNLARNGRVIQNEVNDIKSDIYEHILSDGEEVESTKDERIQPLTVVFGATVAQWQAPTLAFIGRIPKQEN